MKKILSGFLATHLLLVSTMPIAANTMPVEASTIPLADSAPIEANFLDLQGTFYDDFSLNFQEVTDYLTWIRTSTEDKVISTQLEDFDQNQADTLRAQALNRAVYLDILNKITTTSMSQTQKAKAIYDFVMFNFIHYDATREVLPASYLRTPFDRESCSILDRSSWLLSVGTGSCQEFSTLFSRLMNMAGLPCFNVYGTYINRDGSQYWHAFNRAKVNDTWYWYDVDIEGSLYRRGDVSSPLYYLYQKNTSYWRTYHKWEESLATAQEEAMDWGNYQLSSTLFHYETAVEVQFQDINFYTTSPIYGYVDVDSPDFTESVMLLPFFQVLNFLGLSCSWDDSIHRLVVEEGENIVEFSPNSYLYWVNGEAIKMCVPLSVIDGIDYISVEDLILWLDFNMNLNFYENNSGELTTAVRFQGGKSTAQPTSGMLSATPSTDSYHNNERPFVEEDTNLTVNTGDWAFHDGKISAYYGSATHIEIPSHINEEPVTAIGSEAFADMEQIVSVVIPEGVTMLDTWAFARCTNLVSISFPSTLTTIKELAFQGCSSLLSVELPSSVTSIGSGAFYDCTGLTTVYLFGVVEELLGGVFQNCISLTTVVLPEGLKVLNAFSGCTSLESIHLPSTLETIRDSAFYDCTSLSSLVIPEGVTSIWAGAFSNCSSLTSLYIPDSVSVVGENGAYEVYSFLNGCDSLTQLRLSPNATEVSLGDCPALTSVYIPSSVSLFKVGSVAGTPFTIYGESDSYAQTVAEELGFHFIQGLDPNTPEPPLPTTPYVPEIQEWAVKYVDFVSENIMPDISGWNYNLSASRGIVAQSLYNMLGGETEATHSFTDTGDFHQAITWCFETGLMSGLDETTFGTEAPCTREQFALILQKLTTLSQISTELGDDSLFPLIHDGDTISPWAKDGMIWAVTNGFFTLVTGEVSPTAEITRTEIAIMLMRLSTL